MIRLYTYSYLYKIGVYFTHNWQNWDTRRGLELKMTLNSGIETKFRNPVSVLYLLTKCLWKAHLMKSVSKACPGYYWQISLLTLFSIWRIGRKLDRSCATLDSWKSQTLWAKSSFCIFNMASLLGVVCMCNREQLLPGYERGASFS